MKTLLIAFSIALSSFAFSQKVGIDFTLNLADDQFSQHVQLGPGVDANFYIPIGKDYVELTPWSFFQMNATKEENITLTESPAGEPFGEITTVETKTINYRYAFLGVGAGYYWHLGPVELWFFGLNARVGLSEAEKNIDFLPGFEIVNHNEKLPVKLSFGVSYSPINDNAVFRLNIGFLFNQ